MDAVFAILPRYSGGPQILNFKRGVRKTSGIRPLREYCDEDEERSGYDDGHEERSYEEAVYDRKGLRSDSEKRGRDIDFEA
ncbi:MAG: hypothetical protein II922_09985 [Succinimonas sp.]|nr:hypothetical protein [Succinimonas sp.]